MANYRNEFEFRSGLLDALGVEHSEADAKNEERWRAKMLDGLEVEYNQNDVNQFDLFRAKLVEGVEAKAEGGGGITPTGTKYISANGTYNIAEKEFVNVNVSLPSFRLAIGYAVVPDSPLYLGGAIANGSKSSYSRLIDVNDTESTADITVIPYNGKAECVVLNDMLSPAEISNIQVIEGNATVRNGVITLTGNASILITP